MKVKYIGNSTSISLTLNKIYDVVSIESGWYRIVDDTGEDYLYPSGIFEFVIFTDQQINFLKAIGINNPPAQISADDCATIEDKISELLQIHGFDENYMPTETGRMCESILDLLSLENKSTGMDIKLYDRVLLTDGNPASIVEVFEEGMFFLADIDKDGDTYTEEVSIDEIQRIL